MSCQNVQLSILELPLFYNNTGCLGRGEGVKGMFWQEDCISSAGSTNYSPTNISVKVTQGNRVQKAANQEVSAKAKPELTSLWAIRHFPLCCSCAKCSKDCTKHSHFVGWGVRKQRIPEDWGHSEAWWDALLQLPSFFTWRKKLISFGWGPSAELDLWATRNRKTRIFTVKNLLVSYLNTKPLDPSLIYLNSEVIILLIIWGRGKTEPKTFCIELWCCSQSLTVK